MNRIEFYDQLFLNPAVKYNTKVHLCVKAHSDESDESDDPDESDESDEPDEPDEPDDLRTLHKTFEY